MSAKPDLDRQERQRYRIDQLMEAANTTKLKRAVRLHAALFVGQLFDRAIKAGKTREILEARISEKLGRAKVASSDFRIERWRLPKKIKEINGDVVNRWENKAEPQRKEAVYYHIVHALCEVIGEDALTWQIRLHELIEGRTYSDEKGGQEVSAAHRVASLLRHMTNAFEVEHDLAALWSRARTLGVGSDLMGGAIMVPLPYQDSIIVWRGGYLTSFPCPAVHLATVPLMQADTVFAVTALDECVSEPHPAHGVFTLWFDIYLVLCPNDMNVAVPHLAFVFRHELELDRTIHFPGFSGCGRTSYGHEEITSLGEFSSNAVDIVTSDGQQWFVEAGPDWEWDDNAGSEVFSSGYDFCVWERDAEDFFKSAELAPNMVPIDAQVVTRWLAISSDDGLLPIGAEWCLDLTGQKMQDPAASGGSLRQGQGDVETWFRRPGFQQNLERALHDQTLESALAEWVRRYRTSLADEVDLWCRRAEDHEAGLRARWQETIRRVTGIAPDISDLHGEG